MKKLFLVGAFALGSLSVMANVAQMTNMEAIDKVTQEEFTEIEVSELPTAVSDAITQNYPTDTIDKAYVNDKMQYKLELALEDGTTGTLYADENGNWIDL